MDNVVALDFERPIVDLERKIEELKALGDRGVDFSDEIGNLEIKAQKLREHTFAELTRWQTVQLSRHPARPYTLDYIRYLMKDFTELHGDRLYADDPAIMGGLALFEGVPLVVIGHQKGRGTKDNVHRNFGMPRPEGYRKAKRLMELAQRFGLPVVTFIDTPGAYPGIGAEERGQAEAIAANLAVMATLSVPIVSIVIGEGGSGGALALGVANRLLMLQYAVYSVISPEGCASILWKDGAQAPTAADVLKLCARDIAELKVADEIIEEPSGGAHRDPARAAEHVRLALQHHLSELSAMPPERLVAQRYEKYRHIGAYVER